MPSQDYDNYLNHR